VQLQPVNVDRLASSHRVVILTIAIVMDERGAPLSSGLPAVGIPVRAMPTCQAASSLRRERCACQLLISAVEGHFHGTGSGGLLR
jgi:hypothetical protein